MNNNLSDSGSLKNVEVKKVSLPIPADGWKLKCGKRLKNIEVVYETYGELSPSKDNVVFICHALTGDAHAAGYHNDSEKKPGWWDNMIGPGKGIDTNYYYVICANILGGCAGTTGPVSINPDTGKPYGSDFPEISVSDIVDIHVHFLRTIGIEKVAAIIGGSFGGMQVLDWAIRHPDTVERCICIASGASLSCQALAFDHVAREAIMADPEWCNGKYLEKGKTPAWGLAHARKIGHITYLSPEIMEYKFGRKKVSDGSSSPIFQIESYLKYQGEKLVKRFDANSYIRITEAMDTFDLIAEYGSLENAFKNIKARMLIIALSSDWLFTPEQSIQLVEALLKANKSVSFCTLNDPYGHDAFLVNVEKLSDVVRAFLPWVSPINKALDKKTEKIVKDTAQPLYKQIADKIEKNARVLDLGCHVGTLLEYLKETKGINGVGIDIDLDCIITTIDKGFDALQFDLNNGLPYFKNNSFDISILSATLHEVKSPDVVISEMVRISKKGIVTFSNIAYLPNRLKIFFKGKAINTSKDSHDKWYNTPAIRNASLLDMIELCKEMKININEIKPLPENMLSRLLCSLGLYNLGSEKVMFTISK